MNASLVEKITCLTQEDKDFLANLIDRLLTNPPLIDPKKQNIIIWPSNNPQHPDDLIVQFIKQKFIGMPRVDKRGIRYWKVRKFYEDESDKEPAITSSTSPELSSKEEIEIILKKPLSEQTKEDREKWAKWVASQPKENKGENNHANPT